MRVVSFTPLTFTGVSTFSTDFQTIMTRAVQIAQIPITALQNKDSDTLQKKTLLGGLAGAAAGLSSRLAALGQTAGGKTLSATTTDAKIVTATNLLTSANQGTDAVFSLNGISIQQPGNVVNSVVSGVTFTIQGASATAATITLASDRSQLSSALQDLVGNYNAVRSQLTAQVGAGAGLLTGDTIVTQLQDTLRQLSSYRSTSGGIRSLADLGVSFSNTGVASFDQPTFDNLSGTQIADAFTFVGSATAGLGGFSKRLSH